MAEIGIPYTLVGSDGTTVVFNDRTSPNFIGFLDADSGITGLLDVADTRESADDLTEGDGGVHGNFWMSRRSGTLQGWFDVQAMSTVNANVQKLKRASRALRGDCVLTWTESGSAIQKQLTLRRAGGKSLQITGRRPKTFTLSLVSAEPRILSAVENSQIIVPGGSGELGITSPIASPLQTTFGAAGNATITNSGDDISWPRFRIDGPITNPTLLNNTTGYRISLAYTLAAGEYLTLDANPRARTILLGGTANRASALIRASSQWWSLSPGSNDVRLLAAAYSSGAQLTTWWRHAFE